MYTTRRTSLLYIDDITLHHNSVNLRHILSVSAKEVMVYPVFVCFFLCLQLRIRTTTEIPLNNAELIRCGVIHRDRGIFERIFNGAR